MSTQKEEVCALLSRHAGLVKKIARRLWMRVPANIEFDDLVQVGMLGLWDAIDRFDSRAGSNFELFASQRIRGSMLDELRRNDWLSRWHRKRRKVISAATQQIEHRLGRAPTHQQIADEAGISLTDYQEIRSGIQEVFLVSLDDVLFLQGDADMDAFGQAISDESASPPANLADKRRRQALVQAIADLPERQRDVMAMYYEQDLTFSAIGQVLHVSETRACQIHHQAIALLRLRLRAH